MSGSGGYAPARAQSLAERRRRWDCRFKLERQPDLRDLVKTRLAMGWSPEQIAGRLTREHGRTLISHEPASRFTISHQPPDRKADRTAASLAAMIHDLSDAMRQTMTFDNGPEFAFHHRITAETRPHTSCCDVRSPWKKSGVENALRLLRRPSPRKPKLDAINPQAIVQAAMRYNHTPRKCLDFLTPDEAFNRFKSTVALQT